MRWIWKTTPIVLVTLAFALSVPSLPGLGQPAANTITWGEDREVVLLDGKVVDVLP